MRRIDERISSLPHAKKSILNFRTLLAVCFLSTGGCSILKTRPVQEMSNTAAALGAAKEVQADTLAPELYRQADEWFSKAKYEYKLKNFAQASNYAKKARNFAEQAEFESIRNGGNRTEIEKIPDSANPMKSEPPPSSPPSPESIPADEYEQRMKEREAQRKSPTPQPSTPPSLEYKSPTQEPLPEPSNL